MATPHSFNRRNSVGSHQLPLPSSLHAPPHSPRTPPPPPSGPSSPRAFTFSNPKPHDSPILASFTAAAHTHSHSQSHTHSHTSSTHAGGIQPSAAFFRPSKPIHQPQYSRPSSPASIPPDDHTHDYDQFVLGPIAGGYSTDDHQPATESVHELQQQQPFTTLKRIKQSREPLLPGPATTSASRPSINVTSATPISPSRLVRNSLDRVLSISRGLSFDSIRRSTSAPRIQPDERERERDRDRHTFESKLSDEENGYSPASAQFTTHNTNTHTDKHQQSLDVRHSRHSVLLSASASGSGASAPSPSPDSSAFNPTPPTRRPPLIAVPVLDPTTHAPVRRYQLHPSRNRFFLKGRILTGGDTPWAFVVAFGTLLSVAGVWFGTTAVWWWQNESPAVAAVAVYMALLTISTMLATATTDPGILPRNLDPDPPYPATSPSDGGIRAPMPRDLKVRSDIVRVKYCPTCKTYRPPRSSHCKMCDNCVDGCDHHCQWVNNCVGRRNYTTFFALLVFATTTLILIITTSALHLYLLTRRDHLPLRDAMRTPQGAGSAVAFALAICVVWPVGALLSYHMRLLLLNITTIEQIRNQAHKTLIPGPAPPNPFSHGSWRRNMLAVLCRPQGYSWLDAHAVAVEDRREVNPGMVGGEGGRSQSGHGHDS